LDGVRVDGQPPSDIGRIERVLAHLRLRKALGDASHVLPDGSGRRDGDDIETVLARLTDELQALSRVLLVHEQVSTVNALAGTCHITSPDWLNATAVSGLREAIMAAL